MQALQAALRLGDEQIDTTTHTIEQVFANDEACQRLAKLRGLGPLTATALVAAVGDGRGFKMCGAGQHSGPRGLGVTGPRGNVSSSPGKDGRSLEAAERPRQEGRECSSWAHGVRTETIKTCEGEARPVKGCRSLPIDCEGH